MMLNKNGPTSKLPSLAKSRVEVQLGQTKVNQEVQKAKLNQTYCSAVIILISREYSKIKYLLHSELW